MREPKHFAVYIMTNKLRGVLYVGVTSNLMSRISQHRDAQIKGFTQRYKLHHLVWHEPHEDAHAAIAREKQLKRWRRAWKFDLIEALNPRWIDLAPDSGGAVSGPV
jgi:putative endonuclease